MRGGTHNDVYRDHPIATAHYRESHYPGNVCQGCLTRTTQYSYTVYSVRQSLLAYHPGLGKEVMSHSRSDESVAHKLHECQRPVRIT